MSSFNVESGPMTRESDRLLDAVAESQVSHNRHHDALQSQASGMIGRSQQALRDACATLVDRAATLHRQLGEHGMGMREFAHVAVETDRCNRGRIAANGGKG